MIGGESVDLTGLESVRGTVLWKSVALSWGGKFQIKFGMTWGDQDDAGKSG